MDQNIRFDIDPHVIKQLGKELISDEMTALMELVKNSYDADASYVSIEINTEGNYEGEKLQYPYHRGFIVIEDDGFGMDEATILKSWLTISYSNKRAVDGVKPKTPAGRTPLGEKGLGRLSTQRLANVCEIFTRKADALQRLHIAFNWEDFENVDALSQVPVVLNRWPGGNKGTKLVLSNLMDGNVWKGDGLERFKGSISQMISPYAETRPFEVYLRVNGQNFDLVKENKKLRELALTKYEFSFDGKELKISGKIKPLKLIGSKKEEYNAFIAPDNGKKFCDYFFEKYSDATIQRGHGKYLLEFERKYNFYFDISCSVSVDGGKANPGKFFGEFNEFSYDSSFSQDENLKNVFNKFANYKDFAQSQAGVKLYRNGFAVKPYGMGDNDWLKLSSAQTSGASYYGIRPLNVIGFVAIDEGENIHLKDKTDREGLISNPYSENFMAMMLRVRDECNQFIESVRRGYNDFLSKYKIKNNKIQTINQAFRELKSASENAGSIKEKFQRTRTEIGNARQKTGNYVNIVKGSPLFTSEQERQAAKILEEINDLLKNTEELLNRLIPLVEKGEKLSEVIDVLKPKIEILEEQLENFSELASMGLTAETITHEFSSIATRLADNAAEFSHKWENKKLTNADIYVLMEYISSTVTGLRIQLKHIDPSLKYNRESKELIDIENYFEVEELDYYKNRFERTGIRLDLDVRDNFSVFINKGKLTQIFDNLFNNSEYWLQERLSNEPGFKPEIKIVVENPWIYFSDNGYGIPDAVKGAVFEPFVTTKPKGQGRGLGLFIIQQLLDSEGCMIALESKQNELNRAYIFSLNFSGIIK